MSQKDSSSKIKAQPGAPGGKKAGSTKYKMQAAQLAQEAAKVAAQQEAQAKAQKEAAARGETQSEDTVRGLWKSRVLASYKGKGTKDSNTLLAKISDGKAALEIGDRHKSANVQEVMINTVDKMFDVFQNCAYEFNKIAAGTELEINWIRPFLSKEVTAAWQQQEHANLIFSGRVSTRRWTMVVKGTTEEVVIFILPADKLIGFALSANNFKPYFSMIPVTENLDVRWQIEDHLMPPELFNNIYKELFDGLIRFAREEAHPDEVFTLRQIGIVLASENEQALAEQDLARKKLYQEQFFEDMRSGGDYKPGKHVPEFAKPEFPKSEFAKPEFPKPEFPKPEFPKPEFSRPQAPTPAQQSQLHQAMPQRQALPQQPAAAAQTSSGGWKQVPDVNVHNPENARLLAERNATPVNPQTLAPQMPAQMPQIRPQMQPQLPQQSNQLQSGQNMPTMNPQWPSLQQPASPTPVSPPQVQQPIPLQQPGYAPQYQQTQQSSQQLNQLPGQPQYPQTQPQYPQPQYQQQPAQPAPPPQPVRPATFSEALSALLSTLDQELEVVAKAGSDAFAQRDLARADAALKFSGRLSEFRTFARELWEYYGGGKSP
ncbi:MAG TPA: hypothetical protein V6C89_14860 [Drouetiella sp.]|jgi:hypothetical protein